MSSRNVIMNDQVEAETWLIDLSNNLPESYLLVVGPTVQHVTLPAVIVGPQGLVLIHPGDVKAGKDANIAAALRKEEQALRSFLKDEFAGLHLTIRPLIVILHPEAEIAKSLQSIKTKVVPCSELAQEISTVKPSETIPLLPQSSCETIAKALQERQLSRNHRASEPFVFRGGNLLGTDRRAWTLSQVFSHMDRYPSDGVYHMANGTLEKWLNKQGVQDLAGLVRDTVAAYDNDPRAALEVILVKSGLVSARALVISPKKLDLGIVIAGETLKRSITVRPLRRRDFMAVTIEARAPWLEVAPAELKGASGTLEVSVDTAKLAIQDAPYETQVVLNSPHIANATILPVRMRVAGEPSRVNRRLLRPLIALFAAGIIGGVIGLAMSRWGINPPRWLLNLLPGFSADVIWVSIFGIFWALWGLLRGFKQSARQTTGKALLLWLASTALWMIPFGALSMTIAWALGLLYPLLVTTIPTIQVTIVLVGVGLAIVPSVLFQGTPLYELDGSRRKSAPPVAEIGVFVVIVLLIIGGLFWLPSLWSGTPTDAPKPGATGWVTTQLNAIQSWFNQLTDKYYLVRYDHRAPLQTNPAPSATSTRTQTP